jgi:hypothetical protein
MPVYLYKKVYVYKKKSTCSSVTWKHTNALALLYGVCVCVCVCAYIYIEYFAC